MPKKKTKRTKKLYQFELGQRFLANGILSEVLFINNGQAWLGPVKDTASGLEFLHRNVAFLHIDALGDNVQGFTVTEADPECLAV